jgi:cyclopropane fatty-acyl-phospholipid synthase-like methyltransferase
MTSTIHRMGRQLIEWPRVLLSAKADAAKLYDLIGDKCLRFSDDVPIANMGYWREVDVRQRDALDCATRALFQLVCVTGEVSDKDEQVIDVGCGFGTNAIHCARNFHPKRITGVNVSSVQIEIGERLVAEAQLQDRIDFVEASATSMPFPTGSADKILSIEAAFHFNTREDFFEDAHRILRPGGLLALADLVVPPPRNPWERLHLSGVRRSQQIPAANTYGIDDYVAKLEAAGFEILEAESIRGDVCLPFKKYQTARPVRTQIRDTLRFNILYVIAGVQFFLYPWDYLRVKARKRTEGTVGLEQFKADGPQRQ